MDRLIKAKVESGRVAIQWLGQGGFAFKAHAGDVIVVLSGSEIYFHGMIGQLAEGWAIASDHRGSLLAATVQ